VYVLSSRADVIMQIDPLSGTEIGRVLLGSRSVHPAMGSGAMQTLRPRMVLDPTNESLYASLPEAGSLAAVTNDQFPTLVRAIPYVETPDQAWAYQIPGVMQPAAATLPSQPAPTFRAQAPAQQQSTTPDSDEEGL
jgi:hypothetical protein